ncbi:LysR family transcriptional regulator [Bordetella genomosp. 5]|uniref:LysR family transcriptional regulator n=1 Tax=Bordetella genomosp. 5 TaxID=1395608 RepID=A0A261TKY9_9BORD|nr:LysR family transcriptional regulator [Bordetella genomosp. 5]OZI50279.1 LysR family transcriptional regulator [Bordetella genomosp. 5]
MTSSLDASPLLDRLRMRQVALLLAIEEHTTLRSAAEALGMTQPAASKMLQELENALGQRLFDRVGRGLALTPSGACVLSYFRGMRGTLASLARELDDIRLGGGGKLSIGSIMAASPGPLTDALVQLKREYPLLAVEILTGTSDMLISRLHEGELDVVLGRMLSLPAHDYAFRPIEDEALSVIAAVDHPLAALSDVSFEALRAFCWILQPQGSPVREVVEQEFRANDCAVPRGAIETMSILTTTNLVAKTDMIGVIPESVAGRYERHGLVRILPYRIRHSLSAYGTIVRRDRPRSACAARFLELLHGAAQAPLPITGGDPSLAPLTTSDAGFMPPPPPGAAHNP